MTLTVCLGLQGCCRVNSGRLKCLPDVTVWSKYVKGSDAKPLKSVGHFLVFVGFYETPMVWFRKFILIAIKKRFSVNEMSY